MKLSRLIPLLALFALPAWAAPLASDQRLPSAPPNLFAGLLGKSEADLEAKVDRAWRQLFYGDDQNERVYYPVGEDMAYITDVGNQDVRTEGMSYGMMLAVQLDKQAEFDRLWKWSCTHMRHARGPRTGFFAWHCRIDGTPLDPGTASDGEEWFAMALLFASHRWGDGGPGIFNYGAEAQALLHEMRHKTLTAEIGPIFNLQAKQVLFVPDPAAGAFTDPSYHLPAFYELWARWADQADDRAFWAAAARTSRAFFHRAAHPKTGLMPEYAHFDGTPYLETTFGAGKGDFRFDAWRTLANVGLDQAWWRADPWQRGQSDRVLRFLQAQGPNVPNQFTLDGRPLSTDTSCGLTAMAAVAGLAADPAVARPFVQRLWDTPIPAGKWRYYDGLLYLLALLEAGGRFQIPPAHVVFDSFTYTGRDPVFEPPLPTGHFRNPIHAGYYPDPSICRVGDDYYQINSTFAHFPGIPIFHSRDLVNWTQLGHVIDRPTQLKYDGLGVSRGLFAPAISHHDGVFYVVCTMVDAGGNFLVTATNPAGPWSDPVWFDFEGIDPSLFFDDNGRAWMVNNGAPAAAPLYPGHRAIWVQEFDVATKQLIGPRQVIVDGGVDRAKKPIWIEGPHLYKRGGWYYLGCAEGGTGDNHSEVVFRAQSPTGPFVPWDKNPILTQRDLDGSVPGAVTSTGHADLVIGPDGNWWSVFLGCRPFAGTSYATGRETFLLPVKWTDDGWPQILPPGERAPWIVSSPQGATLDPKLTPYTGNFTWGDDFNGAQLSPLWIMLRTPKGTWWHLGDGHLSLTPRADTLDGTGNPSFLGRRLQHAHFDAATMLETPVSAGTSGGLVAFQNETHHYYFAVRRTVGGLSAVVEKWNGHGAETLSTSPLPEVPRIELRLTGDGRSLSFAYALKSGEWHTVVPDADATVITTQAAGGFVGALIGVHARLDP